MTHARGDLRYFLSDAALPAWQFLDSQEGCGSCQAGVVCLKIWHALLGLACSPGCSCFLQELHLGKLQWTSCSACWPSCPRLCIAGADLAQRQ